MKQIETIQNKVGRLALGVNKFVGVEAIRGEMGWSTFEERLMKSKLRFKIRIERMNEERWVKIVSMETGKGSKWLKDCASTADRGGFFKSWEINSRGSNEWHLSDTVGDRNVYDEKKWKSVISARIEEYGLEKWRRGIEGKSSLLGYGMKKCPKREDFYDGSWTSSLLFKARSGSLEINDRTHRFNERRNKHCEFGCSRDGVMLDETVQHIMTECEGYQDEMGRAIEIYKGILGNMKFREITEGGGEMIKEHCSFWAWVIMSRGK